MAEILASVQNDGRVWDEMCVKALGKASKWTLS